MFSSALLLLGGLAAALPVAGPEEPCESRVICVDAINSCGIRFGGCYDVCDVSARPVPPPCPSTTKKPVPTSTKRPTTTIKPTKPPVTSIKTPTITTTTTTMKPSSSTSSCSATVSVCWDGINECGMMYGGCFPDCKPWPTFTPPPCPKTTA